MKIISSWITPLREFYSLYLAYVRNKLLEYTRTCYTLDSISYPFFMSDTNPAADPAAETVVPATETPCTDGTCAPEVEEATTEAPAAE